MPYEDARAHACDWTRSASRRTMFFARNAITERFAVGHLVPQPERRRHGRAPVGVAARRECRRGHHRDAADQLAYARFHMGDGTAPDGTRLLSKAGLKACSSPSSHAGARGDDGPDMAPRRRWVACAIVRHGGATNGQLSAFEMVPERQFAITVLTNANRGVELHGDVTKWALAHYLGARDEEPEAVPDGR